LVKSLSKWLILCSREMQFNVEAITKNSCKNLKILQRSLTFSKINTDKPTTTKKRFNFFPFKSICRKVEINKLAKISQTRVFIKKAFKYKQIWRELTRRLYLFIIVRIISTFQLSKNLTIPNNISLIFQPLVGIRCSIMVHDNC
jgi:hypothetical protein